jgi:hypothetical protein
MNNESCLFIGGPADGKRISIPERQHHVIFPAAGVVHGYEEKLIAGETKEPIRVFVLDGTTASQMMSLLVSKYPAATS